jgi:hypothetical protein
MKRMDPDWKFDSSPSESSGSNRENI